MQILESIRTIFSDPKSYPDCWKYRAALAASFISSGSIVCDIGCGAAERLKPELDNCRYLPADLKRWHDGVEECDLNQERFPDVSLAECTHISLLGVLEYVVDAKAALAYLASYRKPITFSYHPADVRTQSWEEWVSSLTFGDIFVTLGDTGYVDVRSIALPDRQFIFSARPMG